MTDNELGLLTEELTDIETALIFLREGKQRTENLRRPPKQGFPDLDYRISRIETAIDRFQPQANKIRAILRVDEIQKENERKEKEEASK